MRVLETELLKRFTKTCHEGWKQGWHERNGGNMSYRMKKEEVELCREDFHEPEQWSPIGTCAANLAGEYFLVTGSGKYFQNILEYPEQTVCILEINETGDYYRVVWGLVDGGVPTSEFASHFMNHSVKKEVTGDLSRVIYHAHPTPVIALTFVLPLTSRAMTRALWKAMTECPIIFPQGIGVLPWMVPGGAEIAEKTSEMMRCYDAVIWAHHGIFCMGNDFDEAFGLLHAVVKAADITMRVIAVLGKESAQTIPDDGMPGLEERYKIRLNRKFLELSSPEEKTGGM